MAMRLDLIIALWLAVDSSAISCDMGNAASIELCTRDLLVGNQVNIRPVRQRYYDKLKSYLQEEITTDENSALPCLK